MVFGDPGELQAYKTLVGAFETEHPAIKVQLIHIPDQADYRRRLAADFAAGTPADVVLINYRRYASLAAKNALEPLDSYLMKSKLIRREDFYPETIAPFLWRQELMGIPQNLSSLVVYYNKKLFREGGVPFPRKDWTWEDFLATAKALTRDVDGDGQIDQFGLGTEVSIFRLAPFVWQNGGDIVEWPPAGEEEEYASPPITKQTRWLMVLRTKRTTYRIGAINPPQEPMRLALDTPEAMEATRWFVEWQTKHRIVPNQLEESAESSENRFMNGRLGMFLNSRRGVPTYRAITGFDWDVAPLPRHKQKIGILHSDAYCMPTSARNKELAWLFIEYANSVSGQTIVANSGRTVPSLRSVAESRAFLNPNVKPRNNRVFLETIPYMRGVPIMRNWIDIESITGEELKRAYYGIVPLEEAVKTAIDRTQRFFSGEEY